MRVPTLPLAGAGSAKRTPMMLMLVLSALRLILRRRKITNIVCKTGVCFFLFRRKKHTPVGQTMLVILRRRGLACTR